MPETTFAATGLPRQSIDVLMRSLATDLGAWAIGVLLSGAGTDGALGLRAIKEEGGITFAQDPKTASQPSSLARGTAGASA